MKNQFFIQIHRKWPLPFSALILVAGLLLSGSLTDALGRQVWQQEIEQFDGITTLTLPNEQPNGLYYLQVAGSNGFQQAFKILLKR